MTLTKRQRDVLDTFRQLQQRHGAAPTMQAVADQLGVNKATVHEHVTALVRKGFLINDRHRHYVDAGLVLVPAVMLQRALTCLRQVGEHELIEAIDGALKQARMG